MLQSTESTDTFSSIVLFAARLWRQRLGLYRLAHHVRKLPPSVLRSTQMSHVTTKQKDRKVPILTYSQLSIGNKEILCRSKLLRRINAG